MTQPETNGWNYWRNSAPEMMQPQTNTGLLVEFDSVRMRSNLVLMAIYKKGQNFKKFLKFLKNF